MPVNFKLLLATSSSFNDYELMESKLDTLLSEKHPHVELLIGFSDASLTYGRKFAERYGYQCIEYPGGFKGLYNQLRDCDAIVAFSDGGAGIAKVITEGRERGKRVKVVTYVPLPDQPKVKRGKAIVVAGEELIPDVKTKPKKVKGPPVDPAWKKWYRAAHEENFQREYPASFRDGFYVECKYPDPRTTNGITSIIINFLTWRGHYGNRQNVMGRQIGGITTTQSGAKFDDRKWIKSSTKRGSSDISALINGKMISLEVKNAHTNDKIRPEQEKERKRIERAGGVYMVITGVHQFYQWYEGYMRSNLQQQNLFT